MRSNSVLRACLCSSRPDWMRFMRPPISSCCLWQNCSSSAPIRVSRFCFHMACSDASTLSAWHLVFSASTYFFIFARVSWIFRRFKRSLLHLGVRGSVSRRSFSTCAWCSARCLSANWFCKFAAWASNSADFRSQISLNSLISLACACSMAKRSVICCFRRSVRRRSSSCCRSCSSLLLASSASSYCPRFSQSRMCFSNTSTKSCTVCASISADSMSIAAAGAAKAPRRNCGAARRKGRRGVAR
mmetsp:Transcript_85110/g.260055  ORF Transcript_85110/g.260055 Transcript_85110/m.260055 type:complete len:244 (-) Transcript_85110:16-747(-)